MRPRHRPRRHHRPVQLVLVPLLLLLATAGCSSAADTAADPAASPIPAPTAFSLPPEQAEQYDTAYLAEVVANPPGDDLAEGAGEHVVIANNAEIRIDMGGWVIVDADGNRLPLGIGRQIDVGALLRVHSSCGQSTEVAVHACTGVEVLDDDGDELRLLDAAGTEVARFAYGTAGP